jgi:hypothetical protein
VLTEIERLTKDSRPKETEPVERERSVLSPREFERILKSFEEAVYEFDEGKMLDVVEDLEGCIYNGELLNDKMRIARRKVELGDYISALELVSEIGGETV